MPRRKTVPDEEVLDATARVLLREGPTRLSLARVGAEVGLSPATLVQRFGSRAGLMRAFARQAAATVTAPFEAPRPAGEGPLDALHRALLALSAARNASPQAFAPSLAVLLDDLADPEARDAAATQIDRIEAAVALLLEEAMTTGALPPQEPRALAATVVAAWQGSAVLWTLRGGDYPAALRRALDPLLGG